VAAGTPIAPATLAEQLRLLRAAVTIAFPGGLPEYDAARALAELAAEGEAGGAPSEAGAATASALGCDPMDPATAELWWAGKPFDRGGKVADRTGRNDKVKVIARLQRAGGGAPVREPVVSEEERRAMLAWHFKKQEEAKALAENSDDAYLQQGSGGGGGGGTGAAWADPRALKSSLLGTTSVAWRAGGRV